MHALVGGEQPLPEVAADGPLRRVHGEVADAQVAAGLEQPPRIGQCRLPVRDHGERVRDAHLRHGYNIPYHRFVGGSLSPVLLLSGHPVKSRVGHTGVSRSSATLRRRSAWAETQFHTVRNPLSWRPPKCLNPTRNSLTSH